MLLFIYYLFLIDQKPFCGVKKVAELPIVYIVRCTILSTVYHFPFSLFLLCLLQSDNVGITKCPRLEMVDMYLKTCLFDFNKCGVHYTVQPACKNSIIPTQFYSYKCASRGRVNLCQENVFVNYSHD